MIFDKAWRIQRIEVEISGLKAKLNATKYIFDACQNDVPGRIVLDMTELPMRIAELETRAKQLAIPNVKLRGE